ncbi:MAG: hypothetical protein J5649_02685 [Lachnospiraceae bacterium]|nr:hypothetical protein [Lachnospiraceae bacterium]
MSIENRLAAKKRSAQARRNAKIKAAAELGVIILIPVAILIIVLLIWYNSIPMYSRGLDDKGNIKRYSISDNVKLADLDAMTITYDQYKPKDEEIEDEIVSALKSKVTAEKAAEGTDKTDAPDANATTSSGNESTSGDDKKNEAGTGNASNEQTVPATGATDGDDKSDDGDKKDEEKTAAEKEREEYLAMLTDENVEKYFAEVLGEKYAHTVEGYRTYISEKLQLASFNSDASTDILEYLENNSEIKKLPGRRFLKNWTSIMKKEMESNYEYYVNAYASLGATLGKTLYEFYDNRENEGKTDMTAEEYFNYYAESQAEVRVKDTILLLAAFDKLGYTYNQSEVDAFIEEHYTSKDEAVKEYGSEYLALSWRAEKAMQALLDRIHKTDAQ